MYNDYIQLKLFSSCFQVSADDYSKAWNASSIQNDGMFRKLLLWLFSKIEISILYYIFKLWIHLNEGIATFEHS